MDYGSDGCPLCHANDSHIEIVGDIKKNSLTKKGIKRFHMPVAVCDRCGFSFIYPVPSQEELIEVHQDIYYPNWGNNENIIKYSREMSGLLCANVSLPTGSKVLDVGCGEGYLLRQLNSRGFSCFGIEVRSEVDIELLRSEGISVSRAALQSIDYPFTFDLIVLDNVLEHIPFPRSALRKVKRLLKPSGYLVIMVPYLSRDCGGVFIPEHVNFFTPVTIRSMCSLSGFKVILEPGVSGEVSIFQNDLSDGVDSIESNYVFSKNAIAAYVRDKDDFDRLIRHRLQTRLDDLAVEGKTFVFYGAGSYAINLLENLSLCHEAFLGFVDSDPRKAGSSLFSHAVFGLEDLASLNPSAVVICTENDFFVKEIESTLRGVLKKCEIITMDRIREQVISS